MGTLNPYSNVGLKTELVGSVVTPKVSSAGYKFSGAQHRMLQQDIIDNWQILIRRSKGSLRATVPMFVCNKYGQDVPISLTDARDADSFGRALQGYFDGKSVASVSFAMAHNVLSVNQQAIVCHASSIRYSPSSHIVLQSPGW